MYAYLNEFALAFALTTGLVLPPVIVALLLAYEKILRSLGRTGTLDQRLARKQSVEAQSAKPVARAQTTRSRRSVTLTARGGPAGFKPAPASRRPGMTTRWKSPNRVALHSGVQGIA
jgi:hypothetical protein